MQFWHNGIGGQSIGRVYQMATQSYRSNGTIESTANYAAVIDPGKKNLQS